MKRNSIIVMTNGELLETWGSLTEICREHGWDKNYHSLKTKDYPFEFDGWLFRKVNFREKSDSIQKT